MASTAKRIEVRSANGNLMFILRITDESQGGNNRAQARNNRYNRSSSQKNQNGDSNGNGNGDNDGDAITDAQKRYLFRILADQGFQGDQALAAPEGELWRRGPEQRYQARGQHAHRGLVGQRVGHVTETEGLCRSKRHLARPCQRTGAGALCLLQEDRGKPWTKAIWPTCLKAPR